jgi:hypothetical protein
MSKFATVSLLLCIALGVGLCASRGRADDKPPESPRPAAEHQVLKNFVGDWDCEMESLMEPGKPAKYKSTLSGKMVGDFWATIDVKGEMGGAPFAGHGTFGFDAGKKKAIGTWVDSMGDFLWTYDGKIEGNQLILNAKGPSPTDPTKTIPFRDTWDFSTPNKMVLTSEVTGPDGKMTVMMRATGVKRK